MAASNLKELSLKTRKVKVSVPSLDHPEFALANPSSGLTPALIRPAVSNHSLLDCAGQSAPADRANKQSTAPSENKSGKMAPTIYVIYYSMYGHVYKLAKEVQAGLESKGVNVKLFQVRGCFLAVQGLIRLVCSYVPVYPTKNLRLLV